MKKRTGFWEKKVSGDSRVKGTSKLDKRGAMMI